MTNKTDVQRGFERRVIAARYWLLGMAVKDARYYKVIEAMEFAQDHHNGKRNGGGPEFMHQIRIFHKLRAMFHVIADPVTVFILAFLHDAVEDPQKQPDGKKKYISLAEVENRWGTEIAVKVARMSKEIMGIKNEDYSLDAVFADADCAIAKLADRDDNISSMMGVFKRERALRYEKETIEEFVPRAKKARRAFPAQEMAFEILKSSLESQLTLIALMMPTYGLEPVDDPAVELPQPVVENPHTKMVPHTTMILSLTGSQGLLGTANGALIFRNGLDMDNFKQRTMGETVLMTRSTFEAIAGKPILNEKGKLYWERNPLSGRNIILITRNRDKYAVHHDYLNQSSISVIGSSSAEESEDDAHIRTWINVAKAGCKTRELYIAGGPALYEAVMEDKFKDVDSIEATLFDAPTLTGDTFTINFRDYVKTFDDSDVLSFPELRAWLDHVKNHGSRTVEGWEIERNVLYRAEARTFTGQHVPVDMTFLSLNKKV